LLSVLHFADPRQGEHLIDACAQVPDTLLPSCAHLQLLATSRELLGVAGEATWRVASPSVVDPQNQADGDTFSRGAQLQSQIHMTVDTRSANT
jgi:non-specific serine/threonine protein kinase